MTKLIKNLLHTFILSRIKDHSSIPVWSLEGKFMKCKPVFVYDGDTIHVLVVMNNKASKWKVRMLGYDSPEMKPLKINKNRENEIKAAREAKEALSDLILNKIVDIKFDKFDKYGRPLATIYLNGLNINNWMIENNYGYAYSGGTKKTYEK